MAQNLARFSCRIIFPLLIGTVDVNIGSEITRKLCDWGIENTFGVVYLSVEKSVIYDL